MVSGTVMIDDMLVVPFCMDASMCSNSAKEKFGG